MKKTIAALFLALVMIFSCLSLNAYMYNAEPGYETVCKNAIVVNTNSGRVVFEKNADEVVPVASLTKIMTALVVLENCSDLDEMVEVKYSTLLTIGNTGLVTMGLLSGEKVSVHDLLYCMLIKSAADASVVLAEHIGGSIDNFISMMNAKAQEIGMTNSHFVNTHGLDAEGHYSTARDMAALSAYAMKNKTFADIVSRATYTTAQTNMSAPRVAYTTNYLISSTSGFLYEYADGIKTGYTGEAGRCLAATAVKDKVRYVCIILGCDGYNSDGTIGTGHFKDAINLFEQAFNAYSYKKVVKKGAEAAEVPIKCLGIDTNAVGVYEKNVSYLVTKGEKAECNITLDSEKLTKPVKAGDKLGVCEVTLGGKSLGKVNIVAKEDVSRDTGKVALTVLVWVLCGLVGLAVLFFLIVFIGKKTGGRKKRRRAAKRTSTNLRERPASNRQVRRKGPGGKVLIIAVTVIAAVCVALVLSKAGVLPSVMNREKTEENQTSENTQTPTLAPEEVPSQEPSSTGEAPVVNTTESTTSEKKTAWTTALLNVRSGPGTNYDAVTQLPEKSAVTVISEENGWTKIDYQGTERYVSSQYLTYTDPNEAQSTSEAENESQSESTSAAPLSGTTSKGYKIETIDGVTYVDGVLVANKTYSVPKSYGSGLTSETSAAFEKMKTAAEKEGIYLNIISGYRSYETQERLYNSYVERDGKAQADTYSARPGTSEHQTGLAMDLNSLSGSFGETKEGKWLAAHCAEYGFIIRYPQGKQSVTGYIYEPWHVRYLGVDTATKIYQSGLTLEEYYGITSSY